MGSVELSYGTVDVREATVEEWEDLRECAEALANPYLSGEDLKQVIKHVFEKWVGTVPDLSKVTLKDAWEVLIVAAGPRGEAVRQMPKLFADYLSLFFASEEGREILLSNTRIGKQNTTKK
jgi:hypothetical protein